MCDKCDEYNKHNKYSEYSITTNIIMNNTLNSIVKKSKEIGRSIITDDNLSIEFYCNSMQLLKSYIEQLSSIHEQINDIYNECNKRISDELNIPAKNKKMLKQKIAPGVSLNVFTINSLSELPNVNLYYVKEIDQFAIKINKVVIRGNIGNICEYKTPNNSAQCKLENCTGKECAYYHDPKNYKDRPRARNFANVNFLYCSKKTPKTKNMMRVGNRDTLKMDIMALNRRNSKISEINMHMNQTMHYLLTQISIIRNIEDIALQKT